MTAKPTPSMEYKRGLAVATALSIVHQQVGAGAFVLLPETMIVAETNAILVEMRQPPMSGQEYAWAREEFIRLVEVQIQK